MHVPAGARVVTGPQNLTSNQVLRVDGTLLASNDKHAYNLIDPLMGQVVLHVHARALSAPVDVPCQHHAYSLINPLTTAA